MPACFRSVKILRKALTTVQSTSAGGHCGSFHPTVHPLWDASRASYYYRRVRSAEAESLHVVIAYSNCCTTARRTVSSRGEGGPPREPAMFSQQASSSSPQRGTAVGAPDHLSASGSGGQRPPAPPTSYVGPQTVPTTAVATPSTEAQLASEAAPDPPPPPESATEGDGAVSEAGASPAEDESKPTLLVADQDPQNDPEGEAEEEEDEEEEDDLVEEDDRSDGEAGEDIDPFEPIPASSSRRRSKVSEAEKQKRLLRMAKASLQFAELLSSENIHKFVDVTEVSTPSGVRWVDVVAKPALWENRRLARQPEAEFVACVLRALQRERLPLDMYASMAAAGALPSVQVHENWIGLTLRAAKSSFSKADPYNSVFAMSTLSSYFDRQQESQDVAVMTGMGDIATSVASSAAQTQAKLAERLYAEDMARRSKQRRSWDPATGETDMDAAGPQGSVPGGADIFGTATTEDPSAYCYYDEDTNTLLPVNPDSEGLFSRWLRWPWCRSTAFPPNHPLRKQMNGHRRKGYGHFWRKGAGGAGGPKKSRAPTITDETERLSIFLFQEVHPVEEAMAEESLTTEAMGAASKLGRFGLDDHGNNVFTTTEGGARPAPADGAAGAKGKGAADQLQTRRVIVTVHREPILCVHETLIRWQEFLRYDGHLRNDSINRHFSNGDGRSVGWEDIMRHLFHETVRELGRASVAQTRSLDAFEMDVFDDDLRAAERIRRMRGMLGELHKLCRRASMYTDILRESKLAYTKLKKTMNSPITISDRQTFSLLDSAVSLSHSLEEQAGSLLLLNFSVAMNQMETHLRTLTIFQTFFTPLNFIVSYFSMHFTPLEDFYEEENGVYVVLALLVVAAVVTSRWISKTLR